MEAQSLANCLGRAGLPYTRGVPHLGARVLADVDISGLVNLQIVTTCVHRAGDFVLAAKKEPQASIAMGDCQVASYCQWRHVETSVRLSGAYGISVRVFSDA